LKIQQAFDLVRDELKKVETQFRENISSDVYLITKIGEYILRSGGKRFRPLMLLLSSRVAGYKGERHIPLAVVVEFIHTATLLHDDVVDKAKIRRGAESANLVWGNGPSILVGDYLLSRAFELAVNDGDQKILKTLSSTTTRMAEGEMLQMLRHSNIHTTEEEHLRIVAGKTAVLFSASCRMPAILAGLPQEKENALETYGMEVGTAFQLMDDCLDYTSKDEVIGKARGSDIREGKITMPLIAAYGKSIASEKKLIERAVKSEGITDSDMEEIFGIIKKRKGIEYTLDFAAKRVENAKKQLDIFEPTPERAALSAAADFVIERIN